MSNVCSSAAGASPTEIELVTATGVVFGAVMGFEPEAMTGFSTFAVKAPARPLPKVRTDPVTPLRRLEPA